MVIVKIALFLLLLAGLSYLQIAYGKGEKKEAAAYAGLMLAAAVIGALLIAGVRLPSPATPLQAVFEPIGKWFFSQ
ncbi:hypothetical protein FE783_18930 [Paenibacillus mesophilus]|uniref:hypothetical protein n=1 Tax=Paenibacillus mesophilus TaxID=2582849 RepID=UPI00110DD25C|nr:hypothetical protein [Paenibacillus mesophilus]TMV48036.1 hypothetical protein FE783_18930 [Paenibacillus mesophilus]